MARYILTRLFDAVPTMLLVLTLVFLAMRVLPGDPALAALGDGAQPEAIAQFRERFGLNDPLWLQYLHFMRDMLTFDFGTSLMSGERVAQLLLSNLGYTVELTIAAVLLGIMGGIPWASWLRSIATARSMRDFGCFPCWAMRSRISILARCC